MADPKKTQRDTIPKPHPDPEEKPARDTREAPTPNPDGDEAESIRRSELPDTMSRKEAEKLRRNLKR